MPNMSLKKNPMLTQPPEVRAHNFSEVATGYSEEAALDEAMRCLNCKNMPCVAGCPVNIHIPEFIAKVKEGDFAYTEEEVRRVKEAIGDTTLKVILETSILTDEEIKEACLASVHGGAQFVKTSTGFNKAGGASVHAVRIMRETVGENVGVKASGGIHHLSEVEEMVEAGANRIGCSASVNIMKEKELF